MKYSCAIILPDDHGKFLLCLWKNIYALKQAHATRLYNVIRIIQKKYPFLSMLLMSIFKFIVKKVGYGRDYKTFSFR